MNRFLRAVCAATTFPAFVACADVPTDPTVDGLRLSVAVSNPTVAIGDSTVIRATLQNVTARPVGLGFGSSCQITIFVTAADGDVLVPAGGSSACLTVITNLTLPPLGSVSVPMTVHRLDPDTFHYNALPHGAYLAYARLEPNSLGITLESASRAFSVE